ncbi:MAG: hypothetical protein VX951_14510 [Planctomycetota bacterium]|nr:hypothetical protein [Planctomycetota bacterium]
MQRSAANRRPGLVFLGVLALLVPTVLVAQRGYHVDSQFGFRVKLPPKWPRASAEKDRRVVRGRYLSRRTYPIKGARWDHLPEMRVIVISKADAARAREFKKAKGVQAWVPFYLDYADYLARNLDGEMSVLSTEQTEAAGVPCKQYRVRRKAGSGAVYILQTWIFELEKAHAAIEFAVMEQHESKIQKQIRATFASFKTIKAEPMPLGAPFDLPLWITDSERWQGLSARDRLERRSNFQEKFLAAAKADVAAGWRVQKTDHFLVISKAPARYAVDVGKAAELCRKWCDDHLGAVTDDIVMPAVIRIFESSIDHSRYRARSNRNSPYVPEIREIVFTQRREPARNPGALRTLYQGLLHQFLSDKDHHLYRHVPSWLRVGLYQYLRDSKMVRGRFEFVVGEREKNVIREGMRAGNLGTVRALVHHEVPTIEDEEYRLRYQRGRLARLILGPRSSFEDGFLVDYLSAVRAAMKTLRLPPERSGAGVVPGRSTEQSEALQNAWAELRSKLRVTVNAAVCGSDDASWQKIEAGYTKFNKRL